MDRYQSRTAKKPDETATSAAIPRRPSPRRALAGIFRFRTTPLPWRKALGAAVTSGLAFSLGLLLGHVEWGVMAFLGGFTSLYVRSRPYAQSARILAGVGVGMALALALGSLTSFNGFLVSLALGTVAASSTLFAEVWEIGLPAGFMFVLVAIIAAALPPDPGATPIRMAFALIGAALAWGIGLIGWPLHPYRPETRMVRQAFLALADYVDAIGTPPTDAVRNRTAETLKAAHDALITGNPGNITAERTRLMLLARRAQDLFRLAVALAAREAATPLTDWGRFLRAIAAGVDHPAKISEAVPLPPAEGELGRDWIREMEQTLPLIARRPHLLHPSRPRPALPRLVPSLSSHSLIRPAVLRNGLAVFVATLLARELWGSPHPYWVPLTAAAVLLGPTVTAIAERSVQRAIGTLLGLMLGGFIWLLHPSVTGTIALAMILQALLLLTVVRNYGVAVIFITALALTVINIRPVHPIWPLISARFLDTLIGAAIGVAAGLALWSRSSATHLPEALARVIRSEGKLFSLTFSPDSPEPLLIRQWHALQAELLNLRSLYNSALQEIPQSPRSEALWPALVLAERIGYQLFASRSPRSTLPQETLVQTRAVFDNLAHLAAHPEHSAPVAPPKLGGQKILQKTLMQLSRSLKIAPPR